MASSPGLELIFKTAEPLSRKHDCVVVLVHWVLWSKGYLSLHDRLKTEETSELLKPGWNANPDVYELHYVREGQVYILKAHVVDTQLLLSLVRAGDEKVASLNLDCDVWVGPNYHSYRDAYVDRKDLDLIIERELVSPFSPAAASTTATPKPVSTVGGEPIPEPQPPSGIRDERQVYVSDPFAVGGGDLNPLGGGLGGGMLMDPRHPMVRPRQPGIPDNLPFGAVPPGARFDPFGPPGPQRIPFGRGGGPGPRPRGGGGGFGDPDPDHLPPPGYGDMFM